MSALNGRVLEGRNGHPYRVEEPLDLDELGSPKGAMARVFRVFDLERSQDLAAKVINPRLFDDEPELRQRFLAQFYKEARIMEELEHPNIVRLHDYNTEDELPFLIMDYVDGETLDDRLRREGRLRFTEAMSILEPVMSALAYAHSRGVIHRDVKPSNILIDQKGRVLLADFGIARAAQESGLSTRTAMTLGSIQYGTPMYMAPEQALRLPEAVGPHTDQYSLAVLAWRMLAGRYYLARTDSKEGLDYTSLVVGGKPLPLSRYAPNLPPRAEQAIVRALSKSPYERFSSIADFLGELRKALTNPDWTPVADPLSGWEEPDWLNPPSLTGSPAKPLIKLEPVKLPEPTAPPPLKLELPSGEPEWFAAAPAKQPEKQTTEPLNLTLPAWFDIDPLAEKAESASEVNDWFAHDLTATPDAPKASDSQPLRPKADTTQPLKANNSQPIAPKANNSQPLSPKVSQPIAPKAASSQPIAPKVSQPLAPKKAKPSVEHVEAKSEDWALRFEAYPGSEAIPGRYYLDWDTAATQEPWAYEAVRKSLGGRPPLPLIIGWPLLTIAITLGLVLAGNLAAYLALPIALGVATILTSPFLVGWWKDSGALDGRQPMIVTGRLVKVGGPYKEAGGNFILKEGRTPGGYPDPCTISLAPTLAQADDPHHVYVCNLWEPDRLEFSEHALRKRVAIVTLNNRHGAGVRLLALKVLSD